MTTPPANPLHTVVVHGMLTPEAKSALASAGVIHVGSSGGGVAGPSHELPEDSEDILAVRAESAAVAVECATGILRDHGDYPCSASSNDV